MITLELSFFFVYFYCLKRSDTFRFHLFYTLAATKSSCYRCGKFLYGINSLAVFSNYALASWRNSLFAEGLTPEKRMSRRPRRAANPVRRRPNLRRNRGEGEQEQHPPNRFRRMEYEPQRAVHQPEEQLNQPPPPPPPPAQNTSSHHHNKTLSSCPKKLFNPSLKTKQEVRLMFNLMNHC